MAIKRKQPFARASTLGAQLPDLPHLPASLADQDGFTELDTGQRRWWDQVRTSIGDMAGASDQRIITLTKSITIGDATLSAQITNEATARANADLAEASTRTSADATLQTNINTVSASVVTEATARATADGQLFAQWGVAIDINGRIVGRINLDGTNQSSTFKVGVDKFVVENANGTIVAMDIRTGGKIVFGADVQSDNYSVGSAGWQIQRNSGSAEFNNVTVRGTIFSTSGTIGGFTLSGSSITGGSGTSSIALNPSGISGIVQGDFSTNSQSSITSRGAYEVYEGGHILGFLSTSGSAGSRVGFLELLNPAGTPNFIASGNGNWAAAGVGVMGGDLQINTGGTTIVGYGNTTTGFGVEAANGTLFASRSSNFSGSFNRNSDGTLVIFNRSGSQVGSISVTTTTTAYNTSSDRRLKMNITDLGSVGNIIDRIRVREFEFRSNPGKRYMGWISQELYEVYPDAVTRGDDGDEIAEQWGVDRSALVPLLFREVQELRQRVHALEV